MSSRFSVIVKRKMLQRCIASKFFFIFFIDYPVSYLLFLFAQNYCPELKEYKMFTIVEQGGSQFKVSEGDTLKVPFIADVEEGKEITLDRVLLVSKDDAVTVGTPIVAGAEVKAEVVEHGKDKKVLIIKKKRRKDYRRKNGHRQDFTRIKITSVSV